MDRVARSIELLKHTYKIPEILWSDLILFTQHAEHQIDQIKRRVIDDEKIPHAEKVFSLFQPHT